MKKQTGTRALAALLAMAFLFCAVFSHRTFERRADAADEVLIGQTKSNSETPKYLLVQLNSGSWSNSWNDLHYVYPKGNSGQQYVAYCLESHKTSPFGETYKVVSAPDYSAKTEKGLQTIFRLGYPYSTTFGDNGEYSFSAVDAQAVTQIAIRFWMAYRQVCEPGRDYHVYENLDPYKRKVKAADSDAARKVYNAAMWLFKLADNGYSPTFGIRAAVTASSGPAIVGDGRQYSMTVRVNLREKDTDLACNYAVLQKLVTVDAQGREQALSCSNITRSVHSGTAATSGTVTVNDGETVTFSWPASADLGGKTVKASFTGVSDKADISLIYMGTSSSDIQKLYVTRLEVGNVATADASASFVKAANPTSTPTNTPKPTPTNTPNPTPTNTPKPTPTNTPKPTPTNTPKPTPTNTPKPTPTNTPTPTPTNTPTPTPTNTPTPTPTNTPTPTPTNPPTPTPTNTPTPTPTNTPT
ncbi:MAG: thioester domain-containing protein, partial [Lachnospiraceae bacterium]|nr:thioester domain-containing protein [Lachnospiraceae bacterium]